MAVDSCSIVVLMFHVKWCTRKPWSFSIKHLNNNNNNIIAHNHHTNNNP